MCHVLSCAGPMDPVLVNDKLARGFAKAWNVGSDQIEVLADMSGICGNEWK